MTYDALIIGAGLMGSATARHLSGLGVRVGLIGPGEPADYAAHPGVFASHYDQGRITRTLATDPAWAHLAKEAIARYAYIEQESGVSFHKQCGFLRVGPRPQSPDDFIARAESVGRQIQTPFEKLDEAGLHQSFPFLHFPAEYVGLHEEGNAGVINPLALIAAQQTLAQGQGATLIPETAQSTHSLNGLIEVTTFEGKTYRSQKLLLATGAFTNCFDLLRRKLALRVRAETMVLGQVSPAEAESLKTMPGIWYDFDWHPTIPHVYILPPIAYPDGHRYVKLGADFDPDGDLDSFEAMNHYFRSGGNQERGAELLGVLHAILPGLAFSSWRIKPCALTYPPHGKPMIDALDDSGVYVAVGGCGASAKSSDEIGRLAAHLVAFDTWDSDLDHALFRAEYT